MVRIIWNTRCLQQVRAMEEEGTVVYFKTSPSVCDVHEDEELVYREEWDTCSFEATKFDDDRLHDSVGSAESSVTSDAVWRSRAAILSIFSDMWVIAKRWLHPTDQHDQIVRYRDKLLDCICNSPLLTEDDFQLVRYILSNQSQLSSTKYRQHHNSYHHPSNRHTIFFLTTLLVGITAVAIALLPVQVIFALCISVVLIGGIPLTLRWRMRLAVEQRLDKSIECLQTYLREFETLLSLVSQTTRLIREIEIISHGFSRPSGAVPISKLELQGSTDLQCPLLRKKLFSVCQDGVHSLRKVTQRLCIEFTTKEEFDSHDGYLAFRQLSSLHQFMRDDVEDAKDQLALGEIKDAPSLESLESIKDASSLLAVQNSEMLKRLAIVASFAIENGQEKSTVATAAVDSLSPLRTFIHEAGNSLRWSMDFHKNYLFGEPLTHKRVVAVSEDASTTTVPRPLESVVHEVHCMDLKTQVALQRIRALGSWLGEKCGESEHEKAVMSETVESLRQQLTTIEQDLHGVVDHIAACYQNLDNVDNKLGDGEAITGLSETKGESTDFTEGEESMQVAHGAEEECSDDEMVFEAYVSPSDVIEDRDDLSLDDEGMKSQKESKENTVHMMKELNSVLAVRNIEKQRKRELRERKKQGGLLSPSDISMSHNSSQPVTKLQERTSHKSGAMESLIAKVDGLESKCVLSIESELSSGETKSKSSEFEQPFNLSSGEDQFGNSALNSSAIAQAVAAIALKAGRANKEELFHDDQDSSSTTSEAETA